MTGEAASSIEQDRKTFEVLVFSPRSPSDRRPFSWPKDMRVGEAAAEAASAFGYSGGQPTLAKEGKPLHRDKRLVAAGVRDGDVLELIDAAGGV